MPGITKAPKKKIIQAAFELAKEKGLDAVKAHAVAKKMKHSTQPIYWVFKNMEDLKLAVVTETHKFYSHFLFNEPTEFDEIKSIAWNYMQFAKVYPHLFQIIFMNDKHQDTKIAEINIDGNRAYSVSLVMKKYDFTEPEANDFFSKMWIFCHGIASLLWSKSAKIDDSEINLMTDETVEGLLESIRKKRG